MQSTSYSFSATTTPLAVISSTPKPPVSIRSTFSLLNVGRYSSSKHGLLQNSAYHGFKASAILGSSMFSSTRFLIDSIFSKFAISRTSSKSISGCTAPLLYMSAMLPIKSVQQSSTRSTSCGTPETRLLKFSILSLCQPGSSASTHSESVGRFPLKSTEDGVR